MDFSGQFRLDEDSMALNLLHTPVKNIVQDSEVNCNSQTVTNRKFFEPVEAPGISKILFDSPKTTKKWSLKYISGRVASELQDQSVAYTEICAKLTEEMIKDLQSEDRQKEIKNLRRRVYDALNVMISIGLVIKEKKMMKKDTTSHVNVTKQNLIIRKQKLKEQLLIKKDQATTLIKKQESLDKLIDLNKARLVDESEKIKCPFLLVRTELTTTDEDGLMLEQNKQMDCLKVLSKNPLKMMGDLCVIKELFQHKQMIL